VKSEHTRLRAGKTRFAVRGTLGDRGRRLSEKKKNRRRKRNDAKKKRRRGEGFRTAIGVKGMMAADRLRKKEIATSSEQTSE